MTRTDLLDAAGLDRAAALLRARALVAFPTETVYGLGARADDAVAVAAVFAAKGRPRFNPLIVHVADLAAAEALAVLPEAARALAQVFWPGPLTLVVPLRAGTGLSDLATAGLPSVGLRVPAHPLAQQLLRMAGVPVVAPSANPSGAVSPTTAHHVLEGLGGRIDAVLDGGPCAVGLESTIVGFADGAPVLLRPGGLEASAIERVLGCALGRPGKGDAVTAPGMLASHYAPGAAVRPDAQAPAPGEAWLGFGPDDVAPGPLMASLSPSGDLAEAAARLFSLLRALDKGLGHRGTIAVAPVPDEGLGLAINDRLRRAAAPRPRDSGAGEDA